MTAAKEAIEQKIIDLMLAESALDGLRVIFRGLPYAVAQEHYPFAEVLIESERTESVMTGNLHRRVYDGVITINVRGQDAIQVANRTATVESYRTVQTLVDAIIDLFKRPANLTLADLTFSNGAVLGFQIGTQAEYGISIRYRSGSVRAQARANAYDNMGSVTFSCITQEEQR